MMGYCVIPQVQTLETGKRSRKKVRPCADCGKPVNLMRLRCLSCAEIHTRHLRALYRSKRRARQ